MGDSDEMLARLQALLGEDNQEVVYGAPSTFEPFMVPTPAPKAQDPFTDSEDDEYITSERFMKKMEEPRPDASILTPPNPDKPVEWEEYKLELGQLTKESESFCPWQAIKKYPYTYIGKANREKVDKKFFAGGRCEQRIWDFFYIHRLDNPDPVLLVPSLQFEHFLGVINKKLNTSLAIPHIGPNGGFQVTFNNDGTPQPRYLGRSTNKEMADELKFAVPPKGYLPKDEEALTVAPTDRSLAAFKAKIDLILQAQKGKKLASKEKARIERVAKQQSWNHAIKRVQRYLGLRDIRRGYTAARNRPEKKDLAWVELDVAVKTEAATLQSSAQYDPESPCIFEPEDNVVFVCVDVEAYERNTKIITEIGIATLDTDDIKSVAPGVGGENWMKLIRARHFRIEENKHYENTEFVHGCANRFEFGESEFISIKDAPTVIASCFRPPYSKPGEEASTDAPKRNIVLVGHDVDADINFLRNMGYDVLNLNLKEKHDTASMFRYLRREPHPRNLGYILADLNILGWNLHNAGNDAVYTLHAMIGISVAHIVEKKAKIEAEAMEAKEKQLREKIDEAVKEAIEKTLELNEGWSSGGEGSDGGAPINPESPGRGKRNGFRSRGDRQGGNHQSRENDGSFTWENPQPSSLQHGNGYSSKSAIRGQFAERSRGGGYYSSSSRDGGYVNMNSPWRGRGRGGPSTPPTQPSAAKKEEEDLIGYW